MNDLKQQACLHYLRLLRRFVETSIIWSALFAAFAQDASASFNESTNNAVYKLPVIYDGKQVRVVSDEKLTEKEGREIAEVVEDAIKFDLRELGWTLQDVRAKPFYVGILSTDYLLKVLHSDNGGEALENDLLVVKSKIYKEEKHRFPGVIAHELGHVLIDGALKDPRKSGWSRTLDEGMAQHMEEFFLLSKFKGDYPSGKIQYRDGDLSLTAADAQWVFEHEVLVAQGGYEFSETDQTRWADSVYPMGRQLIEFFRLHLQARGYAINGLGVVVKAMILSNNSFEIEFRKQFGVELETWHQKFVTHLLDTQGKPQARFRDTIFCSEN